MFYTPGPVLFPVLYALEPGLRTRSLVGGHRTVVDRRLPGRGERTGLSDQLHAALSERLSALTYALLAGSSRRA